MPCACWLHANFHRLLDLPDSLVTAMMRFLSVADHLRLATVCSALSTLAKRPSSWEVVEIAPFRVSKFLSDYHHYLQLLAHVRPRILTLKFTAPMVLPPSSRAAFCDMLTGVEQLRVPFDCFAHLPDDVRIPNLQLLD